MSRFKNFIGKINWYPPYIGSGIKVVDYNDSLTYFKVEMKLRWYNRNLVGTHYGGSLYSMCDPFYMFILMMSLGDEYIVWDKSASIDFKRPGKGTVHAIFEISDDKIAEIKNEIQEVGKKTYHFDCAVLDEEGLVVASLKKGVYVRKK